MAKPWVSAVTNKLPWLDRVTNVALKLTDPLVGEQAPRSLKDLLVGVPLGHPLHPAVVAVPIGAWTSTALLDLAGEDRAADLTVLLGVASGVFAAVTGAAQYVDATTEDEPRRIGALHILMNSASLTCYGVSSVLRATNRRDAGRIAAMAGYGFVLAGGMIGGELSYVLGIGVDHTAFERTPKKWVDVLAEDELLEGQPKRVMAKNAPVVLYRHGDIVYATSATCTHLGGPMDEGEVDFSTCVSTCPWHGSQFDIRSGAVVHGPATAPLPAYQVRQQDGRISVRAMPD
jgi:nitrite reductase/ring-hydroxylating ferredoxin subunit/uncharacterized membrane protein